MTENKIIYACTKHIEVAIDDYVNFEEKAPQMKSVTDEHKKCTYCNERAQYMLLP
ncbi:MAG: CxxH/CxxC protein [Tissierellia bacterium]|nr:CxxH/CxxC protein [Tissierellia bacterium]MDD4780454.1 CxxH/CxxC protein [Tissierellia bacterium]